jgi:RNA-binding protein
VSDTSTQGETPTSRTPSPPALSGAQRRRLRGLAHPLQPLVRVGHGGLGDGVVRETDRALDAHELIKIRFLGGKEDLRDSAVKLARELGAHLISTIGHVAILYRQHDDPERRRVAL